MCSNELLCSSWGLKYSSWVLNTYTFTTQKVAIFAEKKYQNCVINVLSKVRFTENIEIQPKPRFRGYSMNILNMYRRRPSKAVRKLVSPWQKIRSNFIRRFLTENPANKPNRTSGFFSETNYILIESNRIASRKLTSLPTTLATTSRRPGWWPSG